MVRGVESRAWVAAALLAAAGLLLASSAVHADETLSILRPPAIVNRMSNEGITGNVYSEPSLFGLPNYQADIHAMVAWDGNNTLGCGDFSASFEALKTQTIEGKTHARQIVALVERGGCSFAAKALKAQAAGAVAVIVYNDEKASYLPKMAADASSFNSINIPGMLIKQEDGAVLQQGYQMFAQATAPDVFANGVWVTMRYTIVNPDDHVEWDYFTWPDNENTEVTTFIKNFQPVVAALGSTASFVPHFKIMDGPALGCYVEGCENGNLAALPCGDQCTNCGRYCRVDPNYEQDVPPTGAEEVTEATVQKCLHQWSQQNNQPLLWWKYVEARAQLSCATYNDATEASCRSKAYAAAGVSDAAQTYIESCRGDTGIYHNDDVAMLNSELDWQDEWEPLKTPYMFVNNFTYYGGFKCESPVSPSTCGPLSIICAGFATGTAPAVCSANANGCSAGVDRDVCGVCGGGATSESQCSKDAASVPHFKRWLER